MKESVTEPFSGLILLPHVFLHLIYVYGEDELHCGIGCVCVWSRFSDGECALYAQGPRSIPLVCVYMRVHTSTCVHNDKA